MEGYCDANSPVYGYKGPRLQSYHDYEEPPHVDTSLVWSIWVDSLPRRQVRAFKIGHQQYHLWSPNSSQVPFYPGLWDPYALNYIPVHPRLDGHIGPGDPTRGPDLDEGDAAFVKVHDVWNCNPPGLSDGFIQLLKQQHKAANKEITRLKLTHFNLPSSVLDAASSACFWCPGNNLEYLEKVDDYGDAVDEVTKWQRDLRIKRAWCAYAALYPSSDHARHDANDMIKRLVQQSILPADDGRMGLWINGDKITELDLCWFLCEAKVPCFVIQELKAQQNKPPTRHQKLPDPSSSFVEGTIIEKKIKNEEPDIL
ncbi:hypothetical protein R3P38DRAFT_3522104 [Favolaschia claudopus]|uniref:Uncharacterized protein n=1 Tax=Favolaschia claudopus TaxID=2862362 RepID=A0AAV9Z5Z0_9AGAR